MKYHQVNVKMKYFPCHIMLKKQRSQIWLLEQSLKTQKRAFLTIDLFQICFKLMRCIWFVSLCISATAFLSLDLKSRRLICVEICNMLMRCMRGVLRSQGGRVEQLGPLPTKYSLHQSFRPSHMPTSLLHTYLFWIPCIQWDIMKCSQESKHRLVPGSSLHQVLQSIRISEMHNTDLFCWIALATGIAKIEALLC